MKIVLLTIASAKEDWANLSKELYQKKISPFFTFEQIALKPKKSDRENAESKRVNDSARILEELTKDDFVILFDEKGREFTSVEFAKKFESCLNLGKKRIVFIIGGAYGSSEELKEKANLKVSLSKLTFNHLVAETVALEQIYRALTIIKNLPYHNA